MSDFSFFPLSPPLPQISLQSGRCPGEGEGQSFSELETWALPEEPASQMETQASDSFWLCIFGCHCILVFIKLYYLLGYTQCRDLLFWMEGIFCLWSMTFSFWTDLLQVMLLCLCIYLFCYCYSIPTVFEFFLSSSCSSFHLLWFLLWQLFVASAEDLHRDGWGDSSGYKWKWFKAIGKPFLLWFFPPLSLPPPPLSFKKTFG